MQIRGRSPLPGSFGQFALSMVLAFFVSLLLFWCVVFLTASETIPDLTSEDERAAFIGKTGILVRFVFAPVFVLSFLLGYPLWRASLAALLGKGVPDWMTAALASVLVAAVSVGLALALLAMLSTDDLSSSVDLALAVFGCIALGLFTASRLVYR